jgi:hypothetical protein
VLTLGKEVGFETLGEPGQVVTPEKRPSKSDRMYANTELKDGAGHLSPHMLPQPYLPVNGKGGEDLSGPYELVEGWPAQITEGWRLGGCAGVHVVSPDRVIVASHYGLVRDFGTPLVWGRNVFQMDESPMRTHAHREKNPENFVTTYDREGTLIDSWRSQDHLFGKVNRIFIDPGDPDQHVWIADSQKQTLFKFTNDGSELVMRVGEVEARSIPDHPWKAQDIGWLPNGDFYTAGLARIDRFNKDGELQASLLCPGTGPGEFSDLHGLILDGDRGRIIVSDRGNSRIQVFDEDWNHVEDWPNIYAPYALRMQQADGHVWVGDGFTSKFLRYDLDGRQVASWGQWGIAPGTFWGPHWIDVDDEGCLYVTEVYAERVQKFRPRSDVSPDDPRLIGPLHRY